jgi:hypothetical protein
MDINAAIIDHQLQGLLAEDSFFYARVKQECQIKDPDALKSLAFLFLCVKTHLGLEDEEAWNCLTEGGADGGVDALHLSDPIGDDFQVTLFQAKYKKDLSAESNFPETEIQKLIQTIEIVFDTNSPIDRFNDQVKTKVREIQSLMDEGLYPKISVVCCNNGKKWTDSAQSLIDQKNFQKKEGVISFLHVNHDRILELLKKPNPINTSLDLMGTAIFEDMNYNRICIGRITIGKIAELVNEHGDRLLDQNIRRYLGLKTEVNKGIEETIKQNPDNFYYFNNGITMLCSRFRYNSHQSINHHVKVEDLQIINGGQTCMTIHRVYQDYSRKNKSLPEEATVLVRLYELGDTETNHLIHQITLATNTQNPVDLKDLKSNDEYQKRLQKDIAGFGYLYRSKRSSTNVKVNEFTSGVVAESVLAVWRKKPEKAKFLTRSHFDSFYEIIFKNLNGAQAITAVLLYRLAENRRRRPHENDPDSVRYGSCFIAMRMGVQLLKNLNIELNELNHNLFDRAKSLIDQNGQNYLKTAIQEVEDSLDRFYKEKTKISWQQLSATFRRTDLLKYFEN